MAARRWVSWWILPVRLFPARDARTPGRGSIMRLHKISRKTRNLPLAERSEGLRASAHALSMTGRDLSGDKELSRSFEPFLNFIIEKQGGQHAHLISIPVVVWRGQAAARKARAERWSRDRPPGRHRSALCAGRLLGGGGPFLLRRAGPELEYHPPAPSHHQA